MESSLGGDLDELLEELNAFAERCAQTDLRHHPQLNLIEALQKQLQIRRGASVRLTAERVIHQLVLRTHMAVSNGGFKT